MKTFTPKPADLTHDWYVIDATDVVLGRLATQAATLLRGKNKPTYAPHADSGNHVIILNADKIALTGNKLGKELYMHSGRPGGLRRDSYAQLLKTNPERIIKSAIKGMLPKNAEFSRLEKILLDASLPGGKTELSGKDIGIPSLEKAKVQLYEFSTKEFSMTPTELTSKYRQVPLEELVKMLVAFL